MGMKIQGHARALLIVCCALLASLALANPVFADTDTTPGGDRWEILDASSSRAYFSILDENDCDDLDENCTVEVRKRSNSDNPPSGSESSWASLFNTKCGSGASDEVRGGDSERAQNENFEKCWTAANYEVEWPIIKLSSKFDITGHCDRDDDECAVTLAVCYNPKDCTDGEDARDTDEASNRIGRLWSSAGSCLYDDDEDDVWACINEEFQDWVDDLSRNDDYDDLIDDLKDDNDDRYLGVAVLGYDDDLNEVGETSQRRDDDRETLSETYQRRWRNATPTAIYREEDEVDLGGYSFRPNQDEYLTINFTGYLEFQNPVDICDARIGCFTLVGKSDFFRRYLQGFHIQITDSKVLDCMDRADWDVDDNHLISLNHPDLITCDERVQEAVNLCPAENIGARHVLFEMHDIGLLRGLLPDSSVVQMRRDLEAARVRAPECLCAAGFEEKDMIIATHDGDDPWLHVQGRRPQDLCD